MRSFGDSMAKYCQEVLDAAHDWFCSFYNVRRNIAPSKAVKQAARKKMSDKAASRFMAMEFAFRFPVETGRIRKSSKQQESLPPKNKSKRFNQAFKHLGFSTHSEYLDSPLWKGIRTRVLIRDGNKCRVCLKNARHVHHRSYDYATMSGRNLGRLVSICDSCHREIEFTGDAKNTLRQAEKKLKLLLHENDQGNVAASKTATI